MRRLSTFVVLVFFGIVLIPGLIHLRQLAGASGSALENRRLAAPPALPHSRADWLVLPPKIDAYLNDSFGLRSQMVKANTWFRYTFFHESTSDKLVLGRNGRLFLGSHDESLPYSLIRRACGIDVSGAQLDADVAQWLDFVNHFRPVHSQFVWMTVPTASVIYPEDLPAWLTEQCAHARPYVEQAEARIKALPENAYFYSPDALFKSLKGRTDVFPRKNFHWFGETPRLVAADLSERVLHRTHLHPTVMLTHEVGSDLAHLLPGIPTGYVAQVPQFAPSGVEECRREARCFPELKEIGPLLDDVGRYTNRAPGGGRLLLVTDSFGEGISGYFSEWFGEVWQFSTNNFALLNDEQRDRFAKVILGTFQPDWVVFVYHDFAFHFTPGDLRARLTRR